MRQRRGRNNVEHRKYLSVGEPWIFCCDIDALCDLLQRLNISLIRADGEDMPLIGCSKKPLTDVPEDRGVTASLRL